MAGGFKVTLRLSEPLRVHPNDRDSYHQELALVLSLPQNAVVGDGFGLGEVIDDDPIPTLTVNLADGYVEPGKTTAWMEVGLIDDNVREPTETFTVPIEVQDAILNGPRVLTGTIRDND